MRYRNLCIWGSSLIMALAFWACSTEEETEVKFSSELLKLTDSSIELSKEATTRTVTVNVDCDWDVAVNNSGWSDLLVQKTSTSSFNITTGENLLREDRTAVITITTKGGLKKPLSVRQAQGDAYVRTDVQSALQFDESEGSRSFQVQSNTSWKITVSYTSGDNDWLEVGQQEGSGSQSVTLRAAKAVTDQERQATITISATEEGVNASASVSVEQTGLSFIDLEVATKQLIFNSLAAGEEKSIEITKSNAQWWVWLLDIEPENDLSWITLSEESGTYKGSIKVNCTNNDTPERRRAVAIIISGNKNGGLKERVNIIQEAGKMPEITDFVLNSTGYILDAVDCSFSYASEFPVTEYGLCYSMKNQMPTVDDDVVKKEGNGTSGQNVSITLRDMEPRKDYYVRAYAKSAVGVAYSTNVLTVSTLGDAPSPDDNPRPF